MTWTAFVFGVLLIGVVSSAFWLKDRELLAPPWLRDKIAVQLEKTLPDFQVAFGDVVAVIDADWKPRFSVRDLRLSTLESREIVSVSDVRAGLDRAALFDRRLVLSSLEASGVLVTMQRSTEGDISLSAGANTEAVRQQAPTLLQLVGRIDDFLLRPSFSSLQHLDVRAVTLRYEDQRARRAWTVDGGRARLERDEDDVQIAVDLAVLGGASGVATLAANYAGVIGEQAAEFGITISNLDARDIASQSAAFAWLRALEAPISGALRGGIQADGTFNPLNATLQIGAGVIQPNPEVQPIPIDGANSYFSYLPAEQLLRFDELVVATQWGRGRLEGQAVLGALNGRQLQDLVGQFRLTDLVLNPDDLYAEPIKIAAAEMDFRLKPGPFELEVGRFQLSDQGQMLSARGRISAGPNGWDASMDAQMDGLDVERLVTLWPEKLKPKTRRWISENVSAGRVSDATAAVRIVQGGKPNIYLGFDFEAADFTFTKHMPKLNQAFGHASLVDNRFAITFDKGGLTAPLGGFVDASGTSFIVPDTTVKPDPPAIVRLDAGGAVQAALSLLDQPPLNVMQKAGLPVELAEGQVEVDGTLSLILKKGLPAEEVSFDVVGSVSNASSSRLIKDREIIAPELSLVVSDEEVRIAGEGTLDSVPLDVVWRQELGEPGARLPGQVTGEVTLNQAALEAFGIKLPPGSVQGSGTGNIRLDMLKGTPPRLSIASDMSGIGIDLAPVGWSKPASTTGILDVAMTLGDDPQVDRLVLDAPGLYAAGFVGLTEDAKLDRVQLNEVRIGDWLNAPVDLVSQGEGRPVAVVVRGGTLDLRNADLPKTSPSGQESGPLTVTLDRLRISDTISVENLRGNFTTSGGLSGAFEGVINGVAPVSGQLTPQNGRSAIKVTAEDAGKLLAATGMMQRARGGRMDLVLAPVGSDGAFDGKLRVADARITNAPAMAALLNAISVVGLINELNGDGIYFSEITADFRLTPSRITFREAAAVGASLGLSMDGVFVPNTGEIAVQGVISPVFMLNSVGSVLTRRGEGLFGFNYSIRGSTDDPKVFVNPLTALAPGMLRNLFRSDEPEVPLEDGEPEPVPEPRRTPVVTRGEDR